MRRQLSEALATPDYSEIDNDDEEPSPPALHEPLDLRRTDFVDWSEVDEWQSYD